METHKGVYQNLSKAKHNLTHPQCFRKTLRCLIFIQGCSNNLASCSFYIAYFLVHSLAVASCLVLSCLYTLAISATKGSSGLGSVSKLQIDKRTFEMVRAG